MTYAEKFPARVPRNWVARNLDHCRVGGQALGTGAMPALSKIKIASWNINSVRARLDIVEKFMIDYAPDILCLQETKVVNGTFPEGLFRRHGYNHQMLNGQPMHHGVAIAQHRLPMRDDDRLDWQANGEARHIGVRLDNGLRIENVYIPAGGEEPDRAVNAKFGQKLDFLERTDRLVGQARRADAAAGRLQCRAARMRRLVAQAAHQRCQPYDRSSATCLPGCRPVMAGWTSAANLPPPSGSTPGGATARRTGRSPTAAGGWTICGRARHVADKAVSHMVVEEVRGWMRPSDHAPLITEFVF